MVRRWRPHLGPLTPVTPIGGRFDDKPWLAFDETGGPYDGNIYVHFTRFGSAGIFGTRSTDGGATWLPPIMISTGALSDNNDGAQPTVLPDGSVVTIWLHDLSAETAMLALSRSTDGGATWTPPAPAIPDSQARLPPPRRELAHLHIPQLRP